MKYRFLLSAFFIAFMPLASYGEYRVFLLQIKKKQNDPTQTPDSRLVESTLDPQQYRYYYPVALDEEVSYIATWRCYGRTDDFKEYCPNPKGQIPSSPAP